MNDTDRYKLHHGPYRSPRCRPGDKLLCERRGREVVVSGMTDAPLQWPYGKGRGHHSCIVCGDLIRAVQSESEIAVAHHWGVNPTTVNLWRRALGVPRMTDGTRKLKVALAPERFTEEVRARAAVGRQRPEVRAKISAAKLRKPVYPNSIGAQRVAVARPKSDKPKRAPSERMKKHWEHAEEHGLAAPHHWTDAEIALLGRGADVAIARRLDVPQHIVEDKRRLLGIPRARYYWSPEEIALLGTRSDREIGDQIGRSTEAVRIKRLKLGIAPFLVRHWHPDEIDLLGTDTDRAVAEKLGRTLAAVQTQRGVFRIRAFFGTEEELRGA